MFYVMNVLVKGRGVANLDMCGLFVLVNKILVFRTFLSENCYT